MGSSINPPCEAPIAPGLTCGERPARYVTQPRSRWRYTKPVRMVLCRQHEHEADMRAAGFWSTPHRSKADG
jgi:hypothetical protein